MKLRYLSIFLPLIGASAVGCAMGASPVLGVLIPNASLVNNNQYAITMTANQTQVTQLVVSEYGTRSGSICTGGTTATATFTDSKTLTAGTTYRMSTATSWYMVNNNGGAANWKKVCTRYQYKDAGGTALHTKDCVAWYSGDSGGSNCTSSSCGQNTACTDSW